jgi:hypothetical protein
MAHLLFYFGHNFYVVLWIQLYDFRNFIKKFLGNVLTRNFKSLDSMWKSISLKNWNRMGYTLAAFRNQTSSSTCREKTQSGSINHLEFLNFEFFKHDFTHFCFSIFSIWRAISHQNIHLLRVLSKFFFENMRQKTLYVIIINYHSSFNRLIGSKRVILI